MPTRRPCNRLWLGLFGAVLVLAIGPSRVAATPILQLYLEGASYDGDTESWVLNSPGSSAGEPFRLWTIGNVSGPGGKGTIHDVKLSVVYDQSYDPDITITLTPTTAGGTGSYLGFTDPSTPAAPTYIQKNTDGSTPIMSDGRSLPNHGEFGPGRVWQEFALGDFSLEDSPTGDFIDMFPTDPAPGGSQVNVYDVSVLNGSGATIHFDLYDSVESETKARFAPFSHDAEITPTPSAIGMGLCLFAVLATGRPHRKKR